MSALLLVAPLLLLAQPVLTAAQEEAASVSIVLIDPGSEPRSLLRYEWAQGSAATSDIDLHITATTSVDGRELMSLTIPTSMTLASRVVDVDAGGVARIEWHIEALHVAELEATIDGEPPAATDMRLVADEMDELGEALGSVGGHLLVDPRGAVLDRSVTAEGPGPPELLSEIERTIARIEPLPEEAVGLGATWEATSSLGAGLATPLRTRSRFVDLTSGRVVLAQIHDTPPMRRRGGSSEPDALTVREVEVDGVGEVSFALDRPATTGHEIVTMRLHLLVDDGSRRGQAVDHLVVTDLTMTSQR